MPGKRTQQKRQEEYKQHHQDESCQQVEPNGSSGNYFKHESWLK
jgi:hypothetical protein